MRRGTSGCRAAGDDREASIRLPTASPTGVRMTRTLRAGALTAAALSLDVRIGRMRRPDAHADAQPTRCRPLPPPTRRRPPSRSTRSTTVTALVARPEALELRDEAWRASSARSTTCRRRLTRSPRSRRSSRPRRWPRRMTARATSRRAPPTAGTGSTLWEQRYVDRWEGVVEELSLARPAFMVEFTGPSVVDVDLSTSDGRQAGDRVAGPPREPDRPAEPVGVLGPLCRLRQQGRCDAGWIAVHAEGERRVPAQRGSLDDRANRGTGSRTRGLRLSTCRTRRRRAAGLRFDSQESR